MSRPSWLTFVVWLIVAVLLTMAVCSKNSGAAVHAKAPTYAGECNFEHRMDIEIIGGIWFECQCIALANGWDCAWVELGEPAVANLKRRIRKHLAHRRIVIAYAKPSVVA